MTFKDKILDLWLRGYKINDITKIMSCSKSTVIKYVKLVPKEMLERNQAMVKERLAKGWDKWEKYILSPNRTKFLRMAENGLYVPYTPSKKPMGNKIYRRLGRTYLTVVERDIKEREK